MPTQKTITLQYALSGQEDQSHLFGTVTVKFDGQRTYMNFNSSMPKDVLLTSAFSLQRITTGGLLVANQPTGYHAAIYGLYGSPYAAAGLQLAEPFPVLPTLLPPGLLAQKDGKTVLYRMRGRSSDSPNPAVGTATYDGKGSITSFVGTQYDVRLKYSWSNYKSEGGFLYPSTVTYNEAYQGRQVDSLSWTLASATVSPGSVTAKSELPVRSSVQDFRTYPDTATYGLSGVLNKDGTISLAAMNKTAQYSHERSTEVTRASLAGYAFAFFAAVIAAVVGFRIYKLRAPVGGRRSGFTLIELLVVIGIIGVLAGILYPVLAKAKLSAKKMNAVSNIGQVSLSISMYLTDNNDRFPFGSENIPPSNRYEWWPEVVTPYVTKAPLPHRGPYGGVVIDDLNPVFFDPLKTGYSELHDPYFKPGQITGFDVSFGLSNTLGHFFGYIYGYPAAPALASSVQDPASCIELVETKAWDEQGSFHTYPPHRPGDAIAFTFFDSTPMSPPGVIADNSIDAPYPSGNPWTSNTQPDGFTPCAFADGHVKMMRGTVIVTQGKWWSLSGSSTTWK